MATGYVKLELESVKAGMAQTVAKEGTGGIRGSLPHVLRALADEKTAPAIREQLTVWRQAAEAVLGDSQSAPLPA